MWQSPNWNSFESDMIKFVVDGSVYISLIIKDYCMLNVCHLSSSALMNEKSAFMHVVNVWHIRISSLSDGTDKIDVKLYI